MSIKQNQWLNHLENAVPKGGYGKKLSMYAIALEAWRRGIKVKFFTFNNPDNKFLIRYSLSSENKEIEFESTRSNQIPNKTLEICNNKQMTKDYLSTSGVPVPPGRSFTLKDADTKILEEAKLIGFPLVLKPLSANAGKGVFTNISNEDELKEVLIVLREELVYSEIVIEKYIAGQEYRIFIVGNKIIAATNRVPANVTGDGFSTVRELVIKRNRQRKNNPNLASLNVVIDKEVLRTLKSQNYTIDSVPEKGEKVYLRKISNVSAGGDPVDFTDELTENMKNTALLAASSIPGLGVCGIDIIMEENGTSFHVIEVNTKPAMGLHLYPVKGKARDTVKAVIDYYFPETINRRKSNLYFDFDKIIDVLKGKVTDEIDLLPPSGSTNITKKLVVSGKVQGVGFRRWVKKEAENLNLNGYTKNLKEGKVLVIISGNDKTTVDEFIQACYKGPDRAEVTSIEEREWDAPLKIGFEIIKETNKKKIMELTRERDELVKQSKFLSEELEQRKTKVNELSSQKSNLLKDFCTLKEKYESSLNDAERLKIEKQILEKKYMLILSSRSWRYTESFRELLRYARNKKG
jgi:D-alanine-D-alanine ligase-like ATP-grasp enzyme/acylphosphatase